MVEPLAKTQIELGALRMVVKALIGEYAIANTQDAAGATQFVEQFRQRLLADIDNINFNITGSGSMTEVEAKELTRDAINEAAGGMSFLD
ncbi:hypothetical protein MKK88_28595 [Methylobacterium sp. E-005]|uniref:hypothetical protein n=1 Tax=Methylobacterium sp. E-005 TaxID=2836549 RepID=UPI001FB9302F|nr:hypothetical protein [Methylobacterium sp. E-005]MCJ2089917.1 hypothetical protein [Methylobacterium sp. E-005]